MKNPKRAQDLRKQLVQFLNTDEAKSIFDEIEFKDNERAFSFGDNVTISANENSPKVFAINIRNNTKEGYQSYNATLNV
ncbi:MAG: hypothetical protein H0U95_01085 [Bacteroidetes bacterium]|nr:hypothetical protein [Bacteroidota bacterium]